MKLALILIAFALSACAQPYDPTYCEYECIHAAPVAPVM